MMLHRMLFGLTLSLLVGPCWQPSRSTAAPNAAPNAAQSGHTNVVLFLVDDMGWMDSTPYGSQYYQTPHMERLAGQAMRFTDAYALPLCSPTRASIMTGQYSSRHGVTSATGHLPPRPADFSYLPESAPPNRPLRMPISKNYLDPAHHTLAETLREAGYRTGHFGKWHLGLTDPHRPDKHGFETAWHCAPDPGPPSYFSPYGVEPDGEPAPRHPVGNITDGPEGEHITDRLTEEAIGFLRKHRDEPFFLNLWHYSVHGPWQHKEQSTRRYAKTSDPRGKQGNPVMASMLQNVDESLGRILETLQELGLEQNTLFIFYSDNGGNTHSWRKDDRRLRNVTEGHRLYETIQSYRRWAGGQPPTNNAPLREGKGRIYEGGMRVPLMVRWPGRIEPGTTSDAVVGPIDLYPTILDALDLPRPNQQTIDGESFLPVLKQTGELKRDAYFTWFPHLTPAVAVRQGKWKLIRHFTQRPDSPEVSELYDLSEDIGESNDLADERPEKAKTLNQLIDRFVEDTEAIYPQPNPNYRPSAGRAAGPAADGLVPKFCRASQQDGFLRIEGTGKTPFLGTAQIRSKRPLRVVVELRCPQGGAGELWWKTAAQQQFPKSRQRVGLGIATSEDWQTVSTTLPIQNRTAIIRLYLPATEAPVDLRRIEYRDAETDQTVRRWDFTGSAP